MRGPCEDTCPDKCSGSLRSVQVGKPHKRPSHNCLLDGMRERQKMNYAYKKHKLFYTL